MPPYDKYLISNILANLILYYLITIFTLFISIFTAFIALINLSRYLINNLFTSDLFDSRIEIAFFSNIIFLSPLPIIAPFLVV